MEYSIGIAETMSTTEDIYQTLAAKFVDSVIQINNESDQHAVAPGSESHLHVVVVSHQFEGISLLARHRMVYEILAGYLRTTVHALALHTYTVSEWEKRMQPAPESPACMGGGKKHAAI